MHETRGGAQYRGETMDFILWIAAGLLALVALVSGFTKTFIPKGKLEHHGAMITHARLGQFKLVMVNCVYLALAVFIAVGRFGPESFTA
jgi:uncharacterized membrane protein